MKGLLAHLCWLTLLHFPSRCQLGSWSSATHDDWSDYQDPNLGKQSRLWGGIHKNIIHVYRLEFMCKKKLFDKILSLKIEMSGRKICSRFERVIELFHFTMQFSNFSFVCFLLSIVFVMSLTKIIKIRKKLLEYFSVWRSYSLKEFLLENRSIFFSISVTILEKRVLESELIFLWKKNYAQIVVDFILNILKIMYILLTRLKKIIHRKIKTYLTGH